jgi:hypothetical protein
VRRWPWPGSVTSVEVEWELSAQDFRAIAETFCQMQRLHLDMAVMDVPLDTLPPRLTSLNISFAGDDHQYAKVDLGLATHLTALRHLALDCEDILPRGWAPLSSLTSLTSVRLTADHQGGCDDYYDDDADSADGMSSVFEEMAIWQALAALPHLKEVHLDKYLDWHSRMPEGVAQLPALSSLLLRCSSQMMEPSSTEGQAPVLQVRPADIRAIFLSCTHVLFPPADWLCVGGMVGGDCNGCARMWAMHSLCSRCAQVVCDGVLPLLVLRWVPTEPQATAPAIVSAATCPLACVIQGMSTGGV